MNGDLALTIDVGTGSSRACVYSIAEDRVLGVAASVCPIHHPQPDRAEFDPDVWWQHIVGVIAEVVKQVGRPGADYLGVTATSLRQGFVLLDRSGIPLAPGVLNYDRRGASANARIEAQLGIGELYRLSGHWLAPELTLPKLLWFQAEQPDVWRRVAVMLFIHDWVLYRLSGRQATNATLICAGQMADVRNRTWAYDLLREFDIRKSLLPPALESGEQLGGMDANIARAVGLPPGLPVHVGGGDTQFGCLGVGGMGNEQVVIVGGSTTPILLTLNRPMFDPLRYPWVSTHLAPEFWALETNAGLTGMLYKWFRDTFGQAQVAEARRRGLGEYEVLNEIAAQASIGAEGLLVVAASPRWAQDTWQRKAPYVIHNFNVNHQIGHVARSILESVCYGVRGNLEQLERVLDKRFGRVLFSGGSANVPLWAQMMADVLDRPLLAPQVVEPAAAAGAQIVLWGTGSAERLPPPPEILYEPDPGRNSAYEPHYQAYVTLFEKMQEHFSAGAD
ncbi:MAG: FGGY-family carbohydrate kinase [Chloroflexi bacterium]|nr:FGGY-family carbohydrate kinase [Chloroflexota bacterium]